MSESKGISLRRKKTTAARPIISGPIQQTPRDPSTDRNNSTYSSVADAKSTRSDATSRERPRLGGDQTSDLVKRRYSTRFTAGIPQDGPTPPMPAMPSMPSQYRSDAASQRSRSRPGPGGREPSAPASGRTSPDKGGERGPSKLKIDMRALKDPNLQAEKYVQAILADATEKLNEKLESIWKSVPSVLRFPRPKSAKLDDSMPVWRLNLEAKALYR